MFITLMTKCHCIAAELRCAKSVAAQSACLAPSMPLQLVSVIGTRQFYFSNINNKDHSSTYTHDIRDLHPGSTTTTNYIVVVWIYVMGYVGAVRFACQ